MQIKNPLTALGAATAGVKETLGKQPQPQTGFENLLAEADRRQQPQADSTINRDDNRRQSDSTGRTERPNREERRAERENRNASNDAPVDNTDTQAATPTEPNEPVDEVEIDENAAAAAVAAILQVPVETVIEWLEQMDLTPQDLVDPKIVSKLLQKALDAENPSQLLTDPTFPELFKAINEAMTELVKEAEVATTVVVNKDAKASVKMVETVELEGLQVVNENGELVVSDITDEEFVDEESTGNQLNNSRTTTTTDDEQQETTAQKSETPDILLKETTDTQDAPVISPSSVSTVTTAKVEAAVTQQTQPQSSSVNPKEVIDQIKDAVRVVSAGGGQFSEIRLTLKPESLGDIILRVITQNGVVVAQFEAENQRVKETLEANFNQLRDSLEEQGLKFSELSVFVRQDGNERMNQFEHARQVAHRRMARMMRVGESQEEEPKPVTPRHNGEIDITA